MTLWRYILKEHVGPFLFAISVIALVFLLNLVFRELGRILSRGLSIDLILEFFFLNMAWIVALAVPMAVLIATLMAFGRLSGDSEIVAMKAGGVSIVSIIFPVLLASALLALGLIWFNNHVLPDFNHRTRLLASDIARKRPTINLEPGVIYRDLNDYAILVQTLEEIGDTSHVGTVFIEDNSEPQSSKYIFAKRGTINMNANIGQLILTLYDGEMHELDLEKMEQYRRLYFPKQVLAISVPDVVLTRSESEYRGDREKSAQMMRQEVDDNSKEILEHQNKSQELIEKNLQTYLGLPPPIKLKRDQNIIAPFVGKFSHDPTRSTLQRIIDENRRLSDQLKGETTIIKNLERSNYVLMVEVHKKYSIPVACIVFVLVGAPLGIMARRGNLTVAGGISFGFFLIHWASLIGGEQLADKQIITPFIAMWLANILVGIGGIYLVIHSIHEATFINWSAIQQAIDRVSKKLNLSNGGGQHL